jgi:hypothetical protein
LSGAAAITAIAAAAASQPVASESHVAVLI